MRKKLKDLLFEQIAPPQMEQDQMMGDFAPQTFADNSLDQKVDRYLIRYERESIPTQSVYEGKLFERKRLLQLSGIILKEQEETPDEPEDEAGDDMDLGGGDEAGGMDFDFGGGDEAGGAPGGEAGGAGGQPVMRTPRIDISSFASAVARLVENYDQLLDPKTTILNRARTYILNNYNEATAEQLMVILRDNFNLSTELSSEQIPQAPLAAGALGEGGG